MITLLVVLVVAQMTAIICLAVAFFLQRSALKNHVRKLKRMMPNFEELVDKKIADASCRREFSELEKRFFGLSSRVEDQQASHRKLVDGKITGIQTRFETLVQKVLDQLAQVAERQTKIGLVGERFGAMVRIFIRGVVHAVRGDEKALAGLVGEMAKILPADKPTKEGSLPAEEIFLPDKDGVPASPSNKNLA